MTTIENIEDIYQKLPQVEIEPEGIYKYIHIIMRVKQNGKVLNFVRGNP